jgi:hypothetical protein
MAEQSHNEVSSVVRNAGITVSQERLAALSAGLALARAIGSSLARIDYGEAEPAARFRPPGAPR